MVEREKFDHIEEILRVIEGGKNYAFVDMAECWTNGLSYLKKEGLN